MCRQNDEFQESEFKLVTARLEHGMKAWRVHEAQSKHYESAVFSSKTRLPVETPQAQLQGGGGVHEDEHSFRELQ